MTKLDELIKNIEYCKELRIEKANEILDYSDTLIHCFTEFQEQVNQIRREIQWNDTQTKEANEKLKEYVRQKNE